MNKVNVKIKNMSNLDNNNFCLPKYATEGSAGIDLCASIEAPITLKPFDKALIPTGIAIGLPSNSFVGLVFARSGLSVKHGITMLNGVGVIDSDYTGEIKCGVINLGNEDYTINPFDRIAQLVIMNVSKASFEVVDELEKTDRGSGGFGSTGK